MNKRRPFFHIIQIVLALFIIGNSIFLFFTIQDILQKRMNNLKQQLIADAEEQLNKKISFESISPSFLRYLKVKGLTISEKTADGVEVLHIQNLRVYFNIITLLQGDILESVQEIRIVNSRFFLPESEWQNVSQFIEGISKDTAEKQRPPLSDISDITPKITGQNVTIRLHLPQGEIIGKNLYFSLITQQTTGNENMHYQMSIDGDFIGEASDELYGLNTLNTSFELEGSLNQNLQLQEFTADIKQFESNLFSVEKQTFHVYKRDNIWNARKIKDKNPIDLLFTYNQDTTAIKTEIKVEKFVPSNIVSFQGRLGQYSEWLNTTISGNISAEINQENKSLSYSADISAYSNHHELPVPVYLSAAFSGTEKDVSLNSIQVLTQKGNISGSGWINLRNKNFNAQAFLKNVETAEGVPVSGNIQVNRRGREMNLSSRSISVASVLLEDIKGTFFIDQLPSVFFSVKTSISGRKPASLSLEGSVTLPNGNNTQPDLHTTISCNNVPVTYIAKNIPFINSYLKRVPITVPGSELTTDAYIHSGKNGFSFAAYEATLNVKQAAKNNAFDTINFRIHGNKKRINLAIQKANIGNFDFKGSTHVLLASENKTEIQNQYTIGNTDYRIHAELYKNRYILIRGNNGINGKVFIHKNNLTLDLQTEKIPLPFTGNSGYVIVNAQGYYVSSNNWEIIFKNSELGNMPFFPQENASVVFSSKVTPKETRFSSLTYHDEISTVTGTGYLDFSGSAPVELQGWMQLSGPEEEYNLFGNYGNDTISLQVEFSDARLSRFQISQITGSAQGSLYINGPIRNPRMVGYFKIADGRFNNDPFSLSARFLADENKVVLEEASGRYLQNKINNTNGLINLQKGSLNIKTSYSGKLQNNDLEADLQIMGTFSSAENIYELFEKISQDNSGSWLISDIRFNKNKINSWDIAYQVSKGDLQFKGGPDNTLSGRINKNGKFSLTLNKPLPVSFSASGTIIDSILNAKLSNMEIKLSELRQFLENSYTDIYSGVIQGTLSLSGPLNDPSFAGNLSLSTLSLKLDMIDSPLKAKKINLDFREKQGYIKPIRIPVGNEIVTLEGNFTINHWLPVQYRLSIETQKEFGIHVIDSFPGVDVDGYAYGTLKIFGDQSVMNISGDLTVRDSIITLSREKDDEETSDTDTNVDLNLQTGRNLEFVWPNRTLPIIRCHADTGEELQVDYKGVSEEFSLKGNIAMKGGQMIYFNRNFYIKEGNIIFNENENIFDPKINVRAEIIEYKKDQEYKIYLIVENEPIKSFSPRFESDPSMTEAEILSTLGENLMVSLGGETINIGTAMGLSSELLTQFGFISQFERKVKEVLNIDLFTIRTRLLQNLAVTKYEELSGKPLDRDGQSLGKYLDNTTIFLGKYLGNELFFESTVRLQNIEVGDSQMLSAGGVGISSEISLEWDTPFFLLEWDFTPQNPNNLFINDNSLSFTWQFSY